MAPFPARHTGQNIALGLDAMLDDLGLNGDDWELFAVSDNAANAKLGIRMSKHLTQHLCTIHTLELGVKDTFKRTQGMKIVIGKTKAIGKFTHESTVATNELKKEAEKAGVKFKKISNPPTTRWSGYYMNLKSVYDLRKPLQSLAPSNERWSEYGLSVAQWKLVEGAVKLLKPVKDTIKVWETEIEPTMQTVIEQLHNLHDIIDEFVDDKNNSKYGIGFAKELKIQIEKRFPNKGGDDRVKRMANYLSPHLKGLHLIDMNLLEETKKDIEEEVKKQAKNVDDNQEVNEVEETTDKTIPPLSPTSKLRKKLRTQMTTQTQFRGQRSQMTPLEKEMDLYMTYSYSKKGQSILKWWKRFEKLLPLLSQVAKNNAIYPSFIIQK